MGFFESVKKLLPRSAADVLCERLLRIPKRTVEQETVLQHAQLWRQRSTIPETLPSRNLCDGWYLSPAELQRALRTLPEQVRQTVTEKELWNTFARQWQKRQEATQRRRVNLQSHNLSSELARSTSTLEYAVYAESTVRSWVSSSPVLISSEQVLDSEDLSGLGLTTFEVLVATSDLSYGPEVRGLLSDLAALRARMYSVNELSRLFRELVDTSRDEPDADRLHDYVTHRVQRILDAVARKEGIDV